ncbi:MAG: hypothetical protein IT382_09185 [Deltaproteobacteria bacterium]|nr:hypothetical protein [Deltaproteobacteria bacterium]
MGHQSLLSDALLEDLVAAGQADVLVGILTLNDVQTIGPVVHAISTAFAGPLHRQRTVLLNIDLGSTDGTPEIVRRGSRSDELVAVRHPLRTVHRISAPYHGAPGRSGALRLVLAAADLLGARSVAMVDPAHGPREPAALAAFFLAAEAADLDVVRPRPPRSPHEAPLITQLVRPLLTAAWGRGFAEPASTELSCSRRFAAALTRMDLWDRAEADEAIDVRLSASALQPAWRAGELFTAEDLHAVPTAVPLARVFRQVVGATLRGLVEDHAAWTALAPATVPPLVALGTAQPRSAAPPRFRFDDMRAAFVEGVGTLTPILASFLPSETLTALARVASAAAAFDDVLWAQILFHAVAASVRRALPVDEVAMALLPLYQGRAAWFLSTIHDLADEDATARLPALAVAMHAARAEYVSRLSGPAVRGA